MGTEIDRRKQKHPQRMRIYLDALIDVPGKAINMNKIINGSEGDIGVIAQPAIPGNDEKKESQRQGDQAFTFSTIRNFICFNIINDSICVLWLSIDRCLLNR